MFFTNKYVYANTYFHLTSTKTNLPPIFGLVNKILKRAIPGEQLIDCFMLMTNSVNRYWYLGNIDESSLNN